MKYETQRIKKRYHEIWIYIQLKSTSEECSDRGSEGGERIVN